MAIADSLLKVSFSSRQIKQTNNTTIIETEVIITNPSFGANEIVEMMKEQTEIEAP
ncbi:hypothetical protein O9929_03775 [Vibrio lentus]|nr:hypothetical protein [Vibrio lentus]